MPQTSRDGRTLDVAYASPVHRLTKAQARRIAVRAQMLDATRPTDLVSLVERLTLLQLDWRISRRGWVLR